LVIYTNVQIFVLGIVFAVKIKKEYRNGTRFNCIILLDYIHWHRFSKLDSSITATVKIQKILKNPDHIRAYRG